jgi:UDP-N-acetyl-D-mannosaminuronate dehydrogenase
VRELAARMPVWVVDTPTNRSAVTALREAAVPGHAGLTTFRSAVDETPEQLCVRILPTIDLHHGKLSQDPPYSAIEVVGTQPTESVQKALQAFHLTVIAADEHGFTASRQTE